MSSTIWIIGLVVIIFAVLCVMYSNDNQSQHSEIDIDNKSEMLELMNEAKNNALEKIKNTKEKFAASLTGTLTNDEANAYLNQLNFLNYWIQNNSGNSGIMGQINSLVQNANDKRIANKKILVDILTNMYSMAYLDFLNHQNAEAYKVYAKYGNPRNNKYYTQYLDS